MKGIILMILSFILGVASIGYFAYCEGRKSAQKEIENRAKNSSDIEYIIFGESQL